MGGAFVPLDPVVTWQLWVRRIDLDFWLKRELYIYENAKSKFALLEGLGTNAFGWIEVYFAIICNL